MRVGSLFAGIGGFDIAAEAMGWETRWFVEWDRHCQAWLAEHFPRARVYGDITKVDFATVERVDVLCGGFPCPPVSQAGKRLGKNDDRWLWPHFARAIRDLRPRFVAVENVPGLLSTRDDEYGQPLMGTVLGELAALGYDAEWEVLSAGELGAPQERERVWIVAWMDDADGGRREQSDPRERADGESRQGRAPVEHAEGRGRRAGPELSARRTDGGRSELGDTSSPGREERKPAAITDGSRHPAGERAVMGDSTSTRCGDRPCVEGGEIRNGARGPEPERRGGCLEHSDDGTPVRQEPVGERRRRYSPEPWADGVPVRGHDGTVRIIPQDAAERGPESPLFPVAPRVPGVVARHRAVGNAVVPQCVVEGPFAVIARIAGGG